ncbi:DUS27 phosphatase, partial [Atrichornis clamosus]|nr:DUS27 phosphatase [Atrichornis clamosus]
RYSVISDTDTESIFMEPIHLSSAVAAKQIISEELKTKDVRVESVCPRMLESAQQLMVEDLYNRVKEKIDDTSLFNTPCVMDLQRALVKDRLETPRDAVDEVWPNVFIAEKSVAVNKSRLKRLGITHVLNAAHGTGVYTGPSFYNGLNIQYLGIEVDDFPDMDISKHFRPAAEFLDEALLTYRGRILVSSEMGISRSAVLVAAYLMIYHHMTILEALMTLRKKRAIYPNDGFLKQLRELNEQLLEERELEHSGDEEVTPSQSPLAYAGASSRLSGAGDSESITGAKAHSIRVEEEDTSSMLSSFMSSSSVEKTSWVSKHSSLISEEEEEQLYEEWRKKQGLSAKEPGVNHERRTSPKHLDQEEEQSDEDVEQRIHDWQRRNEKYQMDGTTREENGDCSMGGRPYPSGEFSDVESVSSFEIRTLKKQLEASSFSRMRRSRTGSMSSESTWDMWNQRLLEIEKEAAQRYHSKNKTCRERQSSGTGRKERDVDEESVFSDSSCSSFYNFCQKNKDKLTPLERWKVKRIQYGFHKKDLEPSSSPAAFPAEDGSQAGQEETEGKSLSDIDLTAYQAWKMKRQKKVGSESIKEEFVEFAKSEDSASAKKKQRRVELLERSKKILEESQSMCSWETDSTMSGSIPLSAFWPSAPSTGGADDAASALSMQTNHSSLSQTRRSTGAMQAQMPSIPLPNLEVGPGDTISMASIQNWIANVVSETIAQKQNEIMMLSRPSSAMASISGDLGRRVDDDKVSLLSAQSGSSLAASQHRQQDLRRAESQSVLSCNASVSTRTEGTSSNMETTQTSKPLYSLFADDVDLKKLRRKEKEMQLEMREKMSDYQIEKVIRDNKRSTLFKKKMTKGEENEIDDVESTTNSHGCPLQADFDRSDTVFNLSSQPATSGALKAEIDTDITKWLSGLKAEREPPSYYDQTEKAREKYSRSSKVRQMDSETASYRFSRSQRKELDSCSSYESKGDSLRTMSRFSSASAKEDKKMYKFTRSRVSETSSRENSPELHVFSQSPEPPFDSESPERSTQSRVRSHHVEACEEEARSDVSEFGAKRKFTQSFSKSEEDGKKEAKVEQSEERFASRQFSQYRRSTRKEEEEEMDDDAIIAAWRSQLEETTAKLQRRREE